MKHSLSFYPNCLLFFFSLLKLTEIAQQKNENSFKIFSEFSGKSKRKNKIFFQISFHLKEIFQNFLEKLVDKKKIFLNKKD